MRECMGTDVEVPLNSRDIAKNRVTCGSCGRDVAIRIKKDPRDPNARIGVVRKHKAKD